MAGLRICGLVAATLLCLLRTAGASDSNPFSSFFRGRTRPEDRIPRSSEGFTRLLSLRVSEQNCRYADQPVVVVDAGSTGTRANLFLVTTKACPHAGRVVEPESIRLLAEGKKLQGLRQLLELWLDNHAGLDWESRPSVGRSMVTYIPQLQALVQSLVSELRADLVTLLDNRLTASQQGQASRLGVPVFFYSTAGVRGFPEWYTEALFILIRAALNSEGDGKYPFFTNAEMARPITGEEEGAFAFLTLNHTAKRLALEGKEGGSDVSRGLLGLVEVGGASTQIVFPLRPYVHVPPFVRRVPVGAEAHLGSRRNLELVSVSFLQLGATSSAGLLLKNICNRPENIKQGICNNPCFPRGYEQSCSAGTPTITKDGQVTISTSTRDNRLKPVALFCASSNPEVSLKALNKLACKANGLDPAATLGERLSFPGCNKIVGTGDFQQCYAAVEQFLVSPQLPVPSNSEASASGFDSVGQVFRLASSDAPIYVTGGALVSAVRTLQSYNLLSRDFKGDVDELVRGAQRFCAIPVRKVSGSGLVFDIKGSAPLPVTAFSHDTCQKLALSASLLRHMNIGESRPEYVRFEDRILDRTGKAIGEYSWHVGAILQYALAKRKWARDMYELGSGFNLPSTAA